MAFTLTSSAFQDGDDIPVRHTCDGQNVSPELTWHEAPATTKAFLLIVDDPDAPAGTFTHWILTDIPGTESTLAEGAVPGRIGATGLNDSGKAEYTGPCPPPGSGVHRYHFRLHALRDFMRFPAPVARKVIDQKLSDLSLGLAILRGRYARGGA